MTSISSGQVFPDPDEFRIYSSTVGREPSAAAQQASELYRASVLRRVEERRRRQRETQADQPDQAEPTS